MAAQVLHTPSGGWSTNAFGARLQQLWRINQGRTSLTRAGKDQLEGWNDFTVSVPVIEQERGNVARVVGAFHQQPRQTWLMFSENTIPGLHQLFESFIPPMCHSALQNIPDIGMPVLFRCPKVSKMPCSLN